MTTEMITIRKAWRHRVGGVLLALEAIVVMVATTAISVACSMFLLLGAGLAFCGTRWHFVRHLRILALIVPVLPLLFLLMYWDGANVGGLLLQFVSALAFAISSFLLLQEGDFSNNPTDVVVRETGFVAWFMVVSSGIGMLMVVIMNFFAGKGTGDDISALWLLSMALAVAGLIGGVGVLRKNTWGRYLCVASVAASVPFSLSPFNITTLLTALSWFLILLIVLFNRNARLYYEGAWEAH